MAPSGNGVMQPLRVVFSALFLLRQQLDPTLRLNKGFAHVTARAQSTEPFWDERVIRPHRERHPTAGQRNTASAKRRLSSLLPVCGRRTGCAANRYCRLRKSPLDKLFYDGYLVIFALAQAVILLMLTPLFTGISRQIRARMHSRRGPGIWQDYRDIHKLFKRREVAPISSGLMFRLMPWVLISSMLVLAMALPLFYYRFPFLRAAAI